MKGQIRSALFRGTEVGVRGKAVPLHAMKAYRGRRGITPLIHNLSIRWPGQPHALAALPPGKQHVLCVYIAL
jgi:hypothetical protein